MELRAKKTMTNGNGNVLFAEGNEYIVVERDGDRLFVHNEIHSESMVKESELDEYFEVLPRQTKSTMSIRRKVASALSDVEYDIEDCGATMFGARSRLVELLAEGDDGSVATFAETYARQYREAYEKRRALEEKKRILERFLKSED